MIRLFASNRLSHSTSIVEMTDTTLKLYSKTRRLSIAPVATEKRISEEYFGLIKKICIWIP